MQAPDEQGAEGAGQVLARRECAGGGRGWMPKEARVPIKSREGGVRGKVRGGGGDGSPEGAGTAAPPNSLEDEEEDGGGEDEQQREGEDAAVTGQHEPTAAVEAIAAREHFPLAPWTAADALAPAAAPARRGGERRGPGARAGGRGGAGAASPGGGWRRGSPGADLLVLAVLHAAGRGPRLRAPRAGRAAPGRGRPA